MESAALIPVEEYLETSYSPDREFRDGILVERNWGDRAHAGLQALLTIYIGNAASSGRFTFTPSFA
jgi:hypothetical protein